MGVIRPPREDPSTRVFLAVSRWSVCAAAAVPTNARIPPKKLLGGILLSARLGVLLFTNLERAETTHQRVAGTPDESPGVPFITVGIMPSATVGVVYSA